MYGTVARFKAKAGTQQQLIDFSARQDSRQIPGYVGEFVYQMDANPDEYYLVVMFESKDTYVANANDPAQDASYRELLVLLEAEPEWHDGEIIHSYRAPTM